MGKRLSSCSGEFILGPMVMVLGDKKSQRQVPPGTQAKDLTHLGVADSKGFLGKDLGRAP